MFSPTLSPNSRILLLSLSLLITTATTVGAAALATFPNGSGPGQVAMLTEEGKLHTGQMTGPAAFLTDGAGNLFVADSLNHRILLVDPRGNLQKTIDLAGIQKAARLEEPPLITDLALAGPSQLYLADLANLVVLVVDLDKGFLRAFGKAGTEAGEFLQINRLRADAEGNAFLEDAAGQKTLVYRPDGSLLAEHLGVTNAAVDQAGNLYQPIFSGDGKVRTIEVIGRSGDAKGVLGRIGDAEEIVFVGCLGFDSLGLLHIAYTTEKGRCFVVMAPDGKIVQTRRHPEFDPGLDVTTPVWVTPDGRIMTIEASAERLQVKELSF